MVELTRRREFKIRNPKSAFRNLDAPAARVQRFVGRRGFSHAPFANGMTPHTRQLCMNSSPLESGHRFLRQVPQTSDSQLNLGISGIAFWWRHPRHGLKSTIRTVSAIGDVFGVSGMLES